MNTYKIIIAVDNEEAAEFAAWLNKQGHDASVGSSTGNYVDGVWTSSDAEADSIMSQLWSDYCNAY